MAPCSLLFAKNLSKRYDEFQGIPGSLFNPLSVYPVLWRRRQHYDNYLFFLWFCNYDRSPIFVLNYCRGYPSIFLKSLCLWLLRYSSPLTPWNTGWEVFNTSAYLLREARWKSTVKSETCFDLDRTESSSPSWC